MFIETIVVLCIDLLFITGDEILCGLSGMWGLIPDGVIRIFH